MSVAMLIASAWMGAVAASPERFTPAVWSPDGTKFAWVAAAGREDAVLPADWLFPAMAKPPSKESERSQLWIAERRTGMCRLAGEGRGKFSAPCWAADGGSLFVAHFEPDASVAADRPEAPGALRIERFYRDGRVAVLTSERGTFASSEIDELSYDVAAAAPNGLFVATPWLKPSGILVVAVDDGKPVARLPQCRLSAWASDSGKLAVYCRRDPAGLRIYSPANWEAAKNPDAKSLIRLNEQAQPAMWDRGGETLLAVRTPLESPTSEPARLEVVRIAVGDGRVQSLLKVPLGEGKDDGPPCYFAYDSRREAATLAVLRPETRSLFERFDLDRSGGETSWHPFGDLESPPPIPLGGQTMSSAGEFLSFRFGVPDWSAPVAVWDGARSEVRTFTPTDAARLRALKVIAAAVRRLLIRPAGDGPTINPLLSAAPAVKNSPFQLFPLPAALAAVDETRQSQLQRLAGHGLAVLRTAGRNPDRSAAIQQRFDEAALMFHYARQEYRPALHALNRLEPANDGEQLERRHAIEILRAQCKIALGEPGIARMWLLDVRRKRENSSARRIFDEILGLSAPVVDRDGNDEYLDRIAKLLEQSPVLSPLSAPDESAAERPAR